MGVLMADSGDNKVRPGDKRWPPRATAHLMLRVVQVAFVRTDGNYPDQVSCMRLARHVRAPVPGEVPIFAVEARDQCHDRTRQRGHQAHREAVRGAILFDLWEMVREGGRDSWVTRDLLSRLLEVSGWEVELQTLNGLLKELVDSGALQYRLERRVYEGRKLRKEIHLYRYVPGSGPRPREEALAAHVARWMGFLPRTIRQRMSGQRGSYLWAMRPDLPPFMVRAFNLRFGMCTRYVLSGYRVDLRRVDPDEELVWVVASSASGPLPGDVKAPEEPGPLVQLASIVLAGELGHLIGNVNQVTRVLQRYLADDIRSRAAAQHLSAAVLARTQHRIRDARTLRSWGDSPLLLDPEGADLYNGGAVGVMVSELMLILNSAWPGSVSERVLRAELERRMVGPLKSPELIDLALRYLEHEGQTERSRDPKGALHYRLREDLLARSIEEREEMLKELARDVEAILPVLYGLVQGHPASHIDSAAYLIRRSDLERSVAVLTATRDRLWKQLHQRYQRMAARGLEVPDSREHVVVAQLSYMPIYADERIFPWLASPVSRSSP